MGRCACDEVVRLAEAEGRAAKRSQEPARTRRAKREPSRRENKTHTKHNTKGENDNEPRVIDRLRVINSLIEEKGRGKEKVPLDPL